MPDDYDTHCRTVQEAAKLLKTGNVTHISLDNDLGYGYTEGRKLALWIERQAFHGTLKRLYWNVHTGNVVAMKEMLNEGEPMRLYNSRPYVVCPDSGRQYTIEACTAIVVCQCGCNRNLAQLFEEQKENIVERVSYINLTPVKRSDKW